MNVDALVLWCLGMSIECCSCPVLNLTPGLPWYRHEQRGARRQLRLPHEHVRLPASRGESRQGRVTGQLQGHAPRTGRSSGEVRIRMMFYVIISSVTVHSHPPIAILGQSCPGHRDVDSNQERVAQRQQQHRQNHRASGRSVQAAAGREADEEVPQGVGQGRQQGAAVAAATATTGRKTVGAPRRN